MLALIEGGHQRLVFERHGPAKGSVNTVCLGVMFFLMSSVGNKGAQTSVVDVFL